MVVLVCLTWTAELRYLPTQAASDLFRFPSRRNAFSLTCLSFMPAITSISEELCHEGIGMTLLVNFVDADRAWTRCPNVEKVKGANGPGQLAHLVFHHKLRFAASRSYSSTMFIRCVCIC